jgi:DNA ligase-1
LLAETLEDVSLLRFPVIVTPKLDGIRVLKVNGKAVTRKFKDLPNRFVRKQLETILPDGIDGEVMSSGSFQDIQSKIMSFDGEPDFTFHAFDYVQDSLDVSYENRLKSLENWYSSIADSRIKLVPSVLIENQEELLKIEEKYLSMGYEGVMIRCPKGRYKCGRSTLREQILLKLKRFKDDEAEVIGFEERFKNTNEKEKDELGLSKRSSKKDGLVASDTLGALVVKNIKTGQVFNIGSGFDDDLRKEIWTNKEKYLNKIIKYKYQELGMLDLPRFPVFIGFRSELDL